LNKNRVLSSQHPWGKGGTEGTDDRRAKDLLGFGGMNATMIQKRISKKMTGKERITRDLVVPSGKIVPSGKREKLVVNINVQMQAYRVGP